MNCANHFDRERAAFCQNCGKPLCTECTRNVGTSVYCEPCLTARVAGTAPSGYRYPGYPYPGSARGPAGPPPPSGEPNPGLAALLGFIPGVGAMYNEQYAKGIVHLIVFAIFVSLASDFNDIFGLFIAGWICYMVAEAYHTARARRDGTPLPNPFGLNDISERLGFGKAWPSGPPTAAPPYAAPGTAPTGDSAAQGFPQDPSAPPVPPYAPPYSYSYVPPVSQWAAPYGVPPIPPIPPMPPYPDPNLPYYRRIPCGAIWLIALGAIFLLGNIPGLSIVRGRLLVPILLIGVGVWLFVRRMLDSGAGLENDGTGYYQWRLHRALGGSVWFVLIGVIFLLHALRILTFAHSWPLFLIGVGVLLFVKRAMYPGYGYGFPPYPGTTPPPAAPVTTTELAPADTNTEPDSTEKEGR
jgi:hypothetical protein